MTDVKGRRPVVEPHLPMLMGLVFGQLREQLALDVPELRPSQLRVLEWLPPEGLTISELAECVDMTTQGCGQFVRQLEGLGMVEVAVADHDARARVVRATDRGSEAVARSAAVLARCDATWAERVGPERYRVFREVLGELALG
ncbi:MarR family winged helix-turn-helix transcriptional regulator [Nocardioides okcheonensis]|uniref:MarR family winged helix-turn-helix transcriptional regulator n=1 Tax=Nocardioides okcheonensis TaxID=2894081 RepID=UPI001E3D7DF4|nr:MarR family winged helix-turn-helix transcriptional regulator [Nocardioides okcheonensis]UFN45939.1 MarR family winged helix-turn-helix transcriptional regulator [Nocardioides okcheonensis]